MSSVPPVSNVPVAKYLRLVLCAKIVLLGVIAIDTRLLASTVTEAGGLVTVPLLAVIITGVLVTRKPVANPLTTILTLVGSEDVHVTLLVMSSVVGPVLVVKWPSAVYCCWSSKESVELGAVTAMDTRVAETTVRVAGGLVIEPEVAVICVVAGATEVACPCVPAELLMVANPGFDDVHVTEAVMSCGGPPA